MPPPSTNSLTHPLALEAEVWPKGSSTTSPHAPLNPELNPFQLQRVTVSPPPARQSLQEEESMDTQARFPSPEPEVDIGLPPSPIAAVEDGHTLDVAEPRASPRKRKYQSIHTKPSEVESLDLSGKAQKSRKKRLLSRARRVTSPELHASEHLTNERKENEVCFALCFALI